jgi:(S)-sulfolactate dehydrogenase
MGTVVISEFMDEAAAARIGATHDTVHDPTLADDRSRLLALIGDARAIIVRNRTVVDADLLAAAPSLEIVGRLGVGLDNIDVAACEAAGVAVRTAAGANASAVAEHVIGALLSLARPALGTTDHVLAGEWPRTSSIGRELGGRRLGLIGLGTTARAVGMRARALGMDVAGHDPLIGEAPFPNLALDDLLGRSDAVSVHVPLTPATTHLLDGRRLGLLPPGAWVVDTSRGGVTDLDALAEALRSGHLGGAAIDVFPDEPPGPEILGTLDGVPHLILTPHVAGVTEESNALIGTMIADAVLETLA